MPACLRHPAHPVEFRTVKVVGTLYFYTFSFDTFLTFLKIITIVTFILIDLLIVYFDNLRTNTIKEITVVSHHQQAEVGTAQVVFEPFGHIKIEVVGGLIKNQEFRFGNQGVGKGDTLQLSTGQLLHFLVEVTNFELRKNLLGFLFVFPSLLLVHTRQEVFQSRMTFSLHATFILLYQFHGTVTVMETGFEHSQLFGILWILFQIIHPKVTTENNVTAIITFFSGDYIQ